MKIMELMQLIIEFTEEEKQRADKYCDKAIDLLKPLTIKEKFLVAKTLYDAFPLADLLEDMNKKK